MNISTQIQRSTTTQSTPVLHKEVLLSHKMVIRCIIENLKNGSAVRMKKHSSKTGLIQNYSLVFQWQVFSFH